MPLTPKTFYDRRQTVILTIICAITSVARLDRMEAGAVLQGRHGRAEVGRGYCRVDAAEWREAEAAVE